MCEVLLSLKQYVQPLVLMLVYFFGSYMAWKFLFYKRIYSFFTDIATSSSLRLAIRHRTVQIRFSLAFSCSNLQFLKFSLAEYMYRL